MRTRPTILYFGPVDTPVPDLVRRWADDRSFPLVVLANRDEVESIILRGHPSLLFVDGARMREEARALVAALKADPFSAIVPVVRSRPEMPPSREDFPDPLRPTSTTISPAEA